MCMRNIMLVLALVSGCGEDNGPVTWPAGDYGVSISCQGQCSWMPPESWSSIEISEPGSDGTTIVSVAGDDGVILEQWVGSTSGDRIDIPAFFVEPSLVIDPATLWRDVGGFSAVLSYTDAEGTTGFWVLDGCRL